MVFPLYKEWMGETSRVGDVYVQGVKEFIQFARKNLDSNEFSCPCRNCRNGKCLHFKTVELHLVQWGFMDGYVFWVFHGERETPFVSEKLTTTKKSVFVDGDPSSHPRLTDLIDDAYGFHVLQDNHIPDVVDCEASQNREAGPSATISNVGNQEKDYHKLKAKAAQPLYPNCNENITTLYALVGLQNIKSRFGLSGNSLSEILVWVKDLLPKENTLPTNYPEMKNCLKGLGMKYKSIHACKYDCILYRKEHEHKDKCPVCQESRYVLKNTENDKHRKFSKVPQKVLKYFPLGPRLKRLYTVPWIAEAMTWHARATVGENLMRHPIDSAIWKSANFQNPDFAKETRNVRLGISTDGFNPFGNLSTNQSVWPVILMPYNLPPSLCMKKEFSILSLLIPGPKAPSNDIDVYLAPLIEELNELWVEGVTAYDASKQEEFTLKAMLLWAIHDFPAYGTLSGCNVHGYFGCPICGEETGSEWLENSKKMCYHTHRRFLPQNHKFRLDKTNFLPNGIEMRPPPRRLSGAEIEAKAKAINCGSIKNGKNPKFVRQKRKRGEEESDKRKAWSRRSLLFDLPYWKEHSVRHMIDVMHLEKNVIEHLMGTCLDGSHSKDNEKAREDLRTMNRQKGLWLKEDSKSGKSNMPVGAFTLSSDERKIFLDTLYELKVPSNFSGNLRRVINYATHDLKQCKSHDWHVIMQLVPLLFKHCFTKHKDLRRAIMQISLCFTLLCEKVVNRNHIIAAKASLAEATCVLEKYFPPAFFDISIHLLVHLCDEVLLCGPVRYRWMYPIERLMKTFKDYVKNTRYIGGSIAEAYITEEASLYAKEYMPNRGVGRNKALGKEVDIEDFDEFVEDKALSKGKRVTLTNVQYEQVARYVLGTHGEVDEWREKYNMSRSGNKKKGVHNTDSDFRCWLVNELIQIGDVKSRLARLANGPSFQAQELEIYRLNDFQFAPTRREQTSLGKQNSGISIKALTYCRASRKDKNMIEAEITYYGVIQQILVLDYSSFKEVVFYCDWVKVEDKTAHKIDPATNLIFVDLTKLKSKDNMNDEPFVCAFENLKQVFYSKYINNDEWSVVIHSPRRLTNSIDNLEAPTNFQSALDDNPSLRLFLDNLVE